MADLRLACPECENRIVVPDHVDRLNCAQCGTELTVFRGQGFASLQRVSGAPTDVGNWRETDSPDPGRSGAESDRQGIGSRLLRLGMRVLAYVLMLPAVGLFGAGIGFLGATLIVASPAARSWLESQAGYRRRLSALPGLDLASPRKFALMLLVYLLPASAVIWTYLLFRVTEANAWAFVIAALLGTVLMWGWLVLGWGTGGREQVLADPVSFGQATAPVRGNIVYLGFLVLGVLVPCFCTSILLFSTVETPAAGADREPPAISAGGDLSPTPVLTDEGLSDMLAIENQGALEPTAATAPALQPTSTLTATPRPTPEPSPTRPTATPTTPPLLRVMLSSINVRHGPGTDFDIVATAYLDDELVFIEMNNRADWYHVVLPDGEEGWIGASLVEPTNPLAVAMVATPTPTTTSTPTPTPTYTSTPSATPTPRPPTPTPTVTPTPIAADAGLTEWIEHEGALIGVRDLRWNYTLSYWRADQGKIYASLYVIAINLSNTTVAFDEDDFELIDGGGQITAGVLFGHINPEFETCTILPGGTCEGWWTTMIWDRPQVRDNLIFRYRPCLITCDPYEVTIRQE